MAYRWVIFFVLSPGIGDAVSGLARRRSFLVLSPQFYALASRPAVRYFCFVFYNTISNGLPWYEGVSSNALKERKGPGYLGFDGLRMDHFFPFSPGVSTQYLVWLAPFILLLSPTFYTWLLGTSSIFAFVFYNTISNGLPWYKGVSTNALNKIWTPWSLLPWGVLIGGAILILVRGGATIPRSVRFPSKR